MQGTAVDGVSVTGVNFVNPFFGTSASAPHAAAIAGLLKDVDGSLDPGDAIKVLRETALERGDPGFDSIWGHGFIDAFAAARRAGQVGNSPLYFMCVPGNHPLQIVAPGVISHKLVATSGEPDKFVLVDRARPLEIRADLTFTLHLPVDAAARLLLPIGEPQPTSRVRHGNALGRVSSTGSKMAKTERPASTAADAPAIPTVKPRLTRRKTDQPAATPADNGANGSITVPTYAIAFRAFELYCARGGGHGHDVEDWLQAESELKSAIRH
jgi:Protein of unknown function (DUF2934)/Subtilase family